MNLIVAFFGGMPMCHGAGGMAGQYFYGARTAGANLMEGALEIALGLFFAASVAGLFAVFPSAIIGAMMLLVGIEMAMFARSARLNMDLVPMGATIAVALLSNMAWGFLAGLAVHYLILFIIQRRNLSKSHPSENGPS
jgi:MFS superfamily sulfate permease-like transporter